MWTLLCLTSFSQNYATFIHIIACIVAYSSSLDFPGGSDGKASAYSAGDSGSIPGSGRSPGEGNGNPLQYPCLENPWTEEPGRLQSMRSQKSNTTE